MTLITAAQARSMAESLWGTGGTHGQRTNRKGCFYYSCSSHGGYVIDTRTLSANEISQIEVFLPNRFEIAHQVVPNGPFRSPFSNRNLSYYSQPIKILFAEEDCDWAVVEHFTDIRLRNRPPSHPEKVFYNWFDPSNPKVQHRKLCDEARNRKDPRFIISAKLSSPSSVIVTTADYKTHEISRLNYKEHKPWLPPSDTVKSE